MQVATAGLREHEQPMSWARALVLATGFFFLAAILIAQVPGYFYTISTLATLTRFEQGTLALGLLAIGTGLICLEVSFLYDPRPLIPPVLFALLGAGIAAVGAFFVVQVFRGPCANDFITAGTNQPGWPETLPGTISCAGSQPVSWPIANQSYLFSSIWFQPGSIDLASVGMIALLVGGGMVAVALLCRPVLAGRLSGAAGALIVRLGLVASFAIIAVYITLLTFAPQSLLGSVKNNLVASVKGTHGAAGNVLLFLALGAALFALAVWLLPIMVARRQQFMPAVYFHGVVGLFAQVGVPLLILWAVIYPAVYLIHQIDSTQFIVQCSQKTLVPGSCTFTPYTGYIIVAIVVGLTFTIFALGLYFWSTRRNTVILAVTIGLVYVGLAATIIHVDDPVQLPIGLFIATCIALLAFAFTWASQREFSVERAEALGCTGQWLVLGTGLLVYLFGFSVFSMPNFFESEALGLNYNIGSQLIHDAFWGALLMGGLGAMQFTLLTRREPMSQLRKFVMWALLVAIALQLVGAIQGFHQDMLTAHGLDWNLAEGSHAVFFAGICFELVGLLAALFGAAIRAQNFLWTLIVVVPVLVGAAGAYVAYVWPADLAEIVVAFFILCTVGAFAYAVMGPDWPGAAAQPVATDNGAVAVGTPRG